jgi:hypothetical protein
LPAITDHPCFQQPANPRERIWRYMDFAKLVSLFQQLGLYLPRIDQLSDPFEGSLSKAEYDRVRATAERGERDAGLPPKWRGRYFDVLMGNPRRARKAMYVSCWHLSDSESEAMWRLYGATYTVAIQSTYARLADLLPGDIHKGCFIGIVHYSDHHREEMPEGNVFHPIMHKRRAFEHEREIRAVVWLGDPGEHVRQSLDDNPNGILVPISLPQLIESIYISPAAPAWFAETVKGVVEVYRKGTPVIQSDLNRAPYI